MLLQLWFISSGGDGGAPPKFVYVGKGINHSTTSLQFLPCTQSYWRQGIGPQNGGLPCPSRPSVLHVLEPHVISFPSPPGQPKTDGGCRATDVGWRVVSGGWGVSGSTVRLPDVRCWLALLLGTAEWNPCFLFLFLARLLGTALVPWKCCQCQCAAGPLGNCCKFAQF